MYRDGSVLPVQRTKDKPYLYTGNPSAIHHKSNKIDHCLKIVDFFIKEGKPTNFVVEPILGDYSPDVFFRDGFNRSICVEIQITPISLKKMQDKVDRFVKEFGKEHDSKLFVLCSDASYNKLVMPKGFKLIKQPLPKEVEF
jgi:hypothetical protein